MQLTAANVLWCCGSVHKIAKDFDVKLLIGTYEHPSKDEGLILSAFINQPNATNANEDIWFMPLFLQALMFDG